MNDILTKFLLRAGEQLSSYPSTSPRKVFGYKRTVSKREYDIFEPIRGRKRIVAACDDAIVKVNRKRNKLYYIPYYRCPYISRSLALTDVNFPGLIENSSILQCRMLPYMREVGPDRYFRDVRLIVITDKCQIYHNKPARASTCDGETKPGDIFRFEESVIWDVPGRKRPVKNNPANDNEVFYPGLPDDCYTYYPLLNTDANYHDKYRNGGFGSTTSVTYRGERVDVPRFYIHKRTALCNPYHFIGTGEADDKLNVIATYRPNVEEGVRTCIFLSDDGGRQWYCKYEFTDYGEYAFQQGHSGEYGHNYGNRIVNSGFHMNYVKGQLSIAKRNISVFGSDEHQGIDVYYSNRGLVSSILDNEHLTMKTEKPHGLSDGNVIALTGKGHYWFENCVDDGSVGNGLFFKVKVLAPDMLSLYELVSSPDKALPCRHIHHVNRTKDGFVIGTGEVYPNGWILYLQNLKRDTYSMVHANDDFKIMCLNRDKNSVQRTMGVILMDDEKNTIVFASDHDTLPRKEISIDSKKDVVPFTRCSTGVFKGYLNDINDFSQYSILYDATEPCFYFQQLRDKIVFCGQRGELIVVIAGIVHRERLKKPIITYYGKCHEYDSFDECIIRWK